MRKLDDTNRTRKEKRTALVGKGGAGDPTLRYLRNYEQSEWRDGKTSHCVYLSSGELYSMTGETPECRDLSEFY